METITARAGANRDTDDAAEALRQRVAPLAIGGAEFRALGHELVDRIAAFYDTLPSRPVTRDASPGSLRQLLPTGPVPTDGTAPGPLLDEAASLLFEHSLHNGSPRFWGYVSSSAAPIGALADLLVAAVNPNVGAWALSPLATEIEAQTVRWIAELLGYPASCGGLLVSGGNMANIVGVLTARHAYATRHGWDVRADGVGNEAGRRLRIYASAEAHTWLPRRRICADWGPRRSARSPRMHTTASILRTCWRDSGKIPLRATCHSWSSPRPALSAPVRSTRCPS